MVIVSSDGNEKYRQEYLNSDPKAFKDITVAYCHLAAHYLKPLYDENDKAKCIGTKVFYVIATNFGGSIPQWITRKIAPKALFDSYEAFAKEAKSIQI